jgi:glycosyltransferase involved in cell wall biosynthesis
MTNKESTIKLAHLQLLPLITGVQKVTLDEFRMVDHSVYEPVLICKEEGILSTVAQKEGIPVYFAPALVRPISPIKDLSAVRQLFRIFRKHSPGILSTHSSKTGILGRIVGRLSGIPVIVHTVHGYAFPYAQSLIVRSIYYLMEYIAGKFCDALVVLNEGDRQIAIRKLKVPEAKVHLIPNGIDIDSFGRTTKERRLEIRRKEFKAEEDVVCIGMVGRLWRQKNPECLLRAAIHVLEQTDKKVKFFFIGDGELRTELVQEITRQGLGLKIQILGWRKDVPSLLSALDIFVLPSRWEGMPLAILEAMASSLPVVVSNISGNNDLVTEDVDGYLFESDNDVQLSERLLMLINDPDKRTRMAESCRQKVIEHYQLQNRIEKIQDLYQSLLKEKSISFSK